MTIGREFQVVPQVEPGTAHHRDRAEAWVKGTLADDVADPLVAPEQRYLVDEMGEQHVEVGVWPALPGTEPSAVAQYPPVCGNPVVLGVSQHVTAIELVEPVGVVAAGKADRACLEQLLQLLNDAEDAYLLVLVDVIKIADRDNAFGVD